MEVVERHRFHYGDEDQLQQGIAGALAESGLEVAREVILGPRNRIDLLVGRIGIEVKVAGTPDEVLRQVTRYTASEDLDALVLVTNRVRHALPDVVNGKPVVLVSIAHTGL